MSTNLISEYFSPVVCNKEVDRTNGPCFDESQQLSVGFAERLSTCLLTWKHAAINQLISDCLEAVSRVSNVEGACLSLVERRLDEGRRHARGGRLGVVARRPRATALRAHRLLTTLLQCLLQTKQLQQEAQLVLRRLRSLENRSGLCSPSS